jgi:hypothetical protein
MSPWALVPPDELAVLPGRGNSDLPSSPFPGQNQRRPNKFPCLRLPTVTALVLVLLVLAAALPRPSLAAIPGSWTLAFPLATGREGHTATLLPNGSVVVAGGSNATDGILNSAEIYDLWWLSGTYGDWVSTGPMKSPRTHHTACYVDWGGLCWLLGGEDSFQGSQGDFVYPMEVLYAAMPSEAYWELPNLNLKNARRSFTSTVVKAKVNGSVQTCILSVGGQSYANYQLVPTATAELLFAPHEDPIEVPPMSGPRADHTATLLRDGRVLVVGGFPSGLYPAEIFDPIALTWTPSPISGTRYWHTATLLADGKVLVVGGIGPNGAEIYDPATGTWSLTNPPIHERIRHTATLLDNGLVLVAGGTASSNTAELYDPATGSWFPTGNLTYGRSDHTATLLYTGQVLVAGGYSSGAGHLTATELYEPEPTPKLPALLGFYPFDNGNAGDFSGNRRHGGVIGSPPVVTGYEGQGFYFGNHNGYIIIPLNINPDNYPRLTMGAWVKTVSNVSLQTVLTHDDGGYDRSIGIDYRGGGTGWSAFCGSGQVLGAAPAIQDAWTFVAVVYDQVHQTVRLQVDDTVLTKDAAVLSHGQNQLFIGVSPLFGNFFDGIIDNVFVFGDALTNKQLAYIRYGGANAIRTAPPSRPNSAILPLLLDN